MNIKMNRHATASVVFYCNSQCYADRTYRFIYKSPLSLKSLLYNTIILIKNQFLAFLYFLHNFLPIYQLWHDNSHEHLWQNDSFYKNRVLYENHAVLLYFFLKFAPMRKSPLIFPKEKTRGLNALNFVFDYLSQLRKDFGFALVDNALCHA